MKRPTADDFFKQFHTNRQKKASPSQETARDIARLAALNHDEFVKQNIRVWETLADDAIRLLIAGLVKYPKSKTAHNMTIKLIVRCIGLMKLFDLMLEGEEKNVLEPPQEFVDDIRNQMLVRIAEIDKEG